MSTPSTFEVTPRVESLRDHLRYYYGRHLKQKSDLTEKACCTEETSSAMRASWI